MTRLLIVLTLAILLAQLPGPAAAAPTICQGRRTAACRNINDSTRQPPRPFTWRIPR